MDEVDASVPAVETVAVDVSSEWNRRVLLSGVNWKVRPGEYWVIGGPHGAGKTDFLMTVAGLHRPAAGTVRIFGRDINQLSEAELLKQRTRIGFVFKNGGRMFTELTVAENVALALCYHHNWSVEQASKEVAVVLEMTELTALADETAQTLGIDLQQRVGLARALALRPEVIFLDEPAAGLEPHHRQWWRNFLTQLSSGAEGFGGRKMTVITTTNDFAPWQGEDHRYALIKDRRWQVLEGKPDFSKMN